MVDPTSTPQALDAPEVPPDPWQLVGSDFEGGITVESVVGVGGFGTVYRAHHRHFRAPVALKVLRCPDGLTAEQRRDLLQRFEQETVVLFRLSRLTLDVASCLAAGTFLSKAGDKTPYIVQEWLDGEPLDRVLHSGDARRRYGLQRALELLAGPMRALLIAHEQGVVHRDIKPSNILVIGREDQLQSKLLDFGIAKLRAEALDSGLGEHGSPRTQGFRFLSVEYAAPEQWDESLGAPSPRTDLFSLALVLVEMLCGKLALKGSNPHALMFAAMNPVERPTPRALGVDVPDAVEALFGRALAVRPEDRPESLQQWWQSLRAASLDHAEWSSAPPRLVEPVEVKAPGPNDAALFSNVETTGPALGDPALFGNTGAAETPASVSSPAPPVVTGNSAPVARHLTSAFYETGDHLSREAARQRRRRIGIWITSSTVGAAAVLVTATSWRLLEPQRPAIQNVQSALNPVSLATDDALAEAAPSVLESMARLVPSASMPETSSPDVIATLTPAPESPASTGAVVTETSNAGAVRRGARPQQVVGQAAAVAAFDPVSPGAAEPPRPQSAATGELRLNSIPPSAIVIDGRPIGSTPKANVHLSPGSHNVTFVHPELGKRKLLVLVESGKSQTLSVKF